MTTVQDILDYLDTIAPPELAESWDNTGFQVGRRDKAVTKILVALDPFEDSCREAADWGAEMLVTHHPLIFAPLKSVTQDTAVGQVVAFLIKNDISFWSGHTNLDIASGGVNDILAQKLGLTQVEAIPPEGLLRIGFVEEQDLSSYLETIKAALECPGLRYVDGGKKCRRVAVGGGACGSELRDAAAAGCDTFVTADIKYNQFWDARDLDINLIDAGHFYTENPVCGYLAKKLAAAFPDIQVRISENHHDCMKFF